MPKGMRFIRLADSKAEGQAMRVGSTGAGEATSRVDKPKAGAVVGNRRAEPPKVGGTANNILNL